MALLFPCPYCLRSVSSALHPGCPPGSVASFLGATRLFSPSHNFFLLQFFFTPHTAPALPRVRKLLPSVLHFLGPFVLGTLPHPRNIQLRPVLTSPLLSVGGVRFPRGTKSTPQPITGDVLLRPPIMPEPAFPARGMLGNFPKRVPGGASHPCGIFQLYHSRGGGAHWVLSLRDGGRPARVKPSSLGRLACTSRFRRH
jgi:hypothetical protein